VKFTPAGGTVTLEIVQKEEGRRQKAEGTENLTLLQSYGLTVSVSDTGIGMSAPQLRNLFQLDSVHSRQGTAGEKGTGLGLIVCKEMLEKHGTTLHVESEEGEGSRFWFVISD
jgi:signal transduction histidine kinase